MQTTKEVKEVTTNNELEIVGRVVSEELEFSHEKFGENFYIFYVSSKRLSETEDVIPIMVSKKICELGNIKKDVQIHIKGSLRSYNEKIGEKSKLILSVFPKEITFLHENDMEDENWIRLQGFICTKVDYRITPLGRKISEFMFAINRPYGKTDYIPIIMWGKNAELCNCLTVGVELKIKGRIQSRIYQKRITEDIIEDRTAYEVSTQEFTI